MDECKPLVPGRARPRLRELQPLQGRGLHSFTHQLNLSALHGTGGVHRGCVARVEVVCRVCRVFLCVSHGSS